MQFIQAPMGFRLRPVLLLLSLISLVSSCGSIRPEAPEIQVTDVAVPEQEVSTIKVPIQVNLTPYFKETEASVPKEFTGKENTCEGVSYAYRFLRGPIQFEGKGGKLQFDVDGKYSLNLSYCLKCTDLFGGGQKCITPAIPASCGVDEAMRKIHVGFETKIGVSSNYKLTAETKLRQIKALTPCEITVFSYDATETLEEELSAALKVVEKDIDKEIGKVDLRPEMAATWKALQEPSDLEGYGYLYLRPSAIGMSEIRYKGDTAYFNALLEARPSIYLYPQEFSEKPLPKLTPYVDHNGFDITTDIFATYDTLSAMLSRNVNSTQVDLNGRKVIFGNVEIHGAYGNMIHLKVEFSGDKKGTLYLTGTPKFDAEKQHLSFPDLTFDLKTKDALLKSAKWLFNGKITNALRDAASMDLRPHLRTLRTSLNASL
ncbi:MAG: hypothetical protein A3D92_10555, partial [Bacteroidetes bacterium RIFCSPHIGHO2_02_FULL_44_7]